MAEVHTSQCCGATSDHALQSLWSRVSGYARIGTFVGTALVPLFLGAYTGSAVAQPGAQEQSSKARATTSTAEAPADPREAVERVFSDPLGGVVVNRTVTVLGKDFYRYFSTRWRQTDESSRYSISIHERPTARFGSEIWVQYRQQRMFHTFLPPARSATRAISEVAVDQVLENVARRELERLTTRNPDLGPEEL